jgi:methyl-accepting chemotaxis protein
MSRLDAPKWGMSTLESCLCMRTLGVYLMSISSSELSTRKQLLVMLSLPLLGLITYAIVTVWGAVSELRATHLSKAAVEAAIATSQLVHEQQKERGLSGGFLASKGQQFGPELGRQRELTNQKLETLKAVARRLSETPVLAEALGQPLELAIGKAGELSDFRRQVDLQAVKAAESFARYTAAISTGVDVISAVAKATNNAEIARDATAYLMFVQAKEFAGRERATLNAAFAAKTFDPESFRRFVGIVSAHDLYMRAFRTFASADASRLADATVKGSDVEEAVRMRKAAFEASPGEELDVPAGQWFKASTARIDLMKAVESKLDEQIVGVLARQEAAALRTVVLALLASTLATIAALVLGSAMIRRLMRRLGGEPATAAAIAHAIAGGDLTQSIEVTPGDTRSMMAAMRAMQESLREMISSVHAAASEVTSQATRLARRVDRGIGGLVGKQPVGTDHCHRGGTVVDVDPEHFRQLGCGRRHVKTDRRSRHERQTNREPHGQGDEIDRRGRRCLVQIGQRTWPAIGGDCHYRQCDSRDCRPDQPAGPQRRNRGRPRR